MCSPPYHMCPPTNIKGAHAGAPLRPYTMFSQTHRRPQIAGGGVLNAVHKQSYGFWIILKSTGILANKLALFVKPQGCTSNRCSAHDGLNCFHPPICTVAGNFRIK
jgi:hypothetical protein